MKIFNFKTQTIVTVLFVINILFKSTAHSLDKFDKADRISDYFSGILLLSENRYGESFNFLKKLNGLEKSHLNYSLKYLYSLINSGNFKEAFNYSKKLERQKIDNFESLITMGLFYLKNSEIDLAQKYFLKAKKSNSRFALNNYVSDSLLYWSNLDNYDFNQASLNIEKLNKRFENLNKIQKVFLNCYYNHSNTIDLYKELVSEKKTDFSRYYYFYASFLSAAGETKKAESVINNALRLYPRNLLLNQYKLDLQEGESISAFNCKNKGHVIAEILYITANALSAQSIYPLSNFYLNLAKNLNEDFHSYDTLLAENFYKTDNLKKAKKIYKNLFNKGKAFKWFASKQLARIYIKEENNNKAFKLLSDSYNNLANKNVYEIFDYAEFLKNNEKFLESIPLYSLIIDKVEKNHPLYAESTDGRGISYERTNEWIKAEKDLLASLKANPDQAYVINYLAYSWIEKGIKIEESLDMLEKANKLKSNDPYITDSLGWALFKLKRYKEAKDYLQLAVKLLPGDPIVNDHYGDVLWKNGKEIQARYYWNYVLSLEKTEEKLKEIVQEKLTKGL